MTMHKKLILTPKTGPSIELSHTEAKDFVLLSILDNSVQLSTKDIDCLIDEIGQFQEGIVPPNTKK